MTYMRVCSVRKAFNWHDFDWISQITNEKKVTRNNTTSEHQALPDMHWSVSVPARLSRKTARKSKRGQSGGGAAAGFTATSGGIRYLFGSATRHFHVSASLFFLSSLASSSYFRAFPATIRLSHDIEHHSVEFCRYPLYSFPARSNNGPLIHYSKRNILLRAYLHSIILHIPLNLNLSNWRQLYYRILYHRYY